MYKQEFLRENDLTVTIKTVDYDEILSRKPKKETKAYKKAATLQIGFVDYTIEIMKRCALEKVKGFDETVDGTEAVFPMIFPENADVLPTTVEYIKSLKLDLLEKRVNGERATYLIRGDVSGIN